MRRLLTAIVVCSAIGAHAYGSTISPDRQYPRFQIGVTGAYATIEQGLAVTIESTEPDSPVAGRLSKGDVVVAVNGRPVVGPDPRVPLGEAIGAAEATDGTVTFQVRRDGMEQTVSVVIPVLGAYSKTWPLDCAKSDEIVRQTAEFVSRSQQEDGAYQLGARADRDSLTACLTGLFLLSTDEPEFVAKVRLQARGLAEKSLEQVSQSSWHLGYQGILLGEYYLKTGDKSVLPGLKTICDQAARSQAAGGWGHGATVNPGYVQSGLMNPAGVPILIALILARECGVEVDAPTFRRALRLFYRMAGHGCVCYGDHRSELFPNTNGKNGMLACALSLLEGEPYQMASEHLALITTDSYYAHEFGHTGGGFNVIWRGMGSVHVPKGKQAHYRRQMDKLAWYYDLCRLPGGGFSMLPSPPAETRYCGVMWGTGGLGLTYTAPRRTLRITGAPRTEFSAKRSAPGNPWGRRADRQFLRTDTATGFRDEGAEPHEIYEMLWGEGNPPVEFCANMMRHYSPMVRTWAARKLADRADEASVEALAKALRHEDPRVRRAALDGISGYDNWGRPTSRERQRGKIPSAVVSSRMVPMITKALRDPASAWWEIDGALWALGRAEPADIRANMGLVKRFAQHEEWYLRESAFWAIVGLHETITGEEFCLLTDIYAREKHVFARSSYNAGFSFLLRGDKVELDAASEARAVRALGRTLH
ncbi:MAG: DUF6288 domain-containing protein, partial [Armatimonadota bacterium]